MMKIFIIPILRFSIQVIVGFDYHLTMIISFF